MATIININDHYGDRVEFHGVNIAEAICEYRQAIIASFGDDVELVELVEGIDYEVVE